MLQGLERELGFKPAQLGELVMIRALWQAVASPLFGTLADGFIGHRQRIVGWGCIR